MPAQAIVDADEALQLSTDACDIRRSADNLDTLACVHAELGDFETAIEIEEEAYEQEPSPDLAKIISAFRADKTWLDVNEES